MEALSLWRKEERMQRIDDETYAKIRALTAQNISQRQIAKRIGVSRQTIKKYMDGEVHPEDKVVRKVEDSTKKLTILALIIAYVNEVKDKVIGKVRLTVATIHRHLNKTQNIGYTTVRRYCKQLGILNKQNEVFISLSFDPGDVMQVDWFEIKIPIAGIITTLPVFIAVLPYSFMFFSMVMPDMSFNSFIQGHLNAFKFFQGVTKHIFYDNVKAAVRIGAGKYAIKQDNFKKFETDYRFKAVFMNPYKGNKKGSVERAVQICRNILSPLSIEADSLEDLQNQNISKIINYVKNHTSNNQRNTIYENYQIEKNSLIPLQRFDYLPEIAKECHVDKLSQIHYKSVIYSIPEEYVNKTITVIGHPYTIDCFYNGKLIATHERSIIKNSYVADPRHYLNTLSKKQNAINNSKALKFAKLTKNMSDFLSAYNKNEKNLILFKLLVLEKNYGEEAFNTEIIHANITNNKTYNYLKSRLLVNHNLLKDIIVYDDESFNTILQNTTELSVDSLDDYESLYKQ
ncbi:MAG: IS21 family transposase [Rickettsiales bacterium]|nr:IS21 family transposase [Rickettsiales bacterium]